MTTDLQLSRRDVFKWSALSLAGLGFSALSTSAQEQAAKKSREDLCAEYLQHFQMISDELRKVLLNPQHAEALLAEWDELASCRDEAQNKPP